MGMTASERIMQRRKAAEQERGGDTTSGASRPLTQGESGGQTASKTKGLTASQRILQKRQQTVSPSAAGPVSKAPTWFDDVTDLSRRMSSDSQARSGKWVAPEEWTGYKTRTNGEIDALLGQLPGTRDYYAKNQAAIDAAYGAGYTNNILKEVDKTEAWLRSAKRGVMFEDRWRAGFDTEEKWNDNQTMSHYWESPDDESRLEALKREAEAWDQKVRDAKAARDKGRGASMDPGRYSVTRQGNEDAAIRELEETARKKWAAVEHEKALKESVMGGSISTADKELGRYGAGNIDLYQRPRYINDDGSVSTVRSITIEEDGENIVIPTVAFGEDGKPYVMDDRQAVGRYHATGEYLGKFKTQEEAEAYAKKLHRAQMFRYKTEDMMDQRWLWPYMTEEELDALVERRGEAAERFGGWIADGLEKVRSLTPIVRDLPVTEAEGSRVNAKNALTDAANERYWITNQRKLEALEDDREGKALWDELLELRGKLGYIDGTPSKILSRPLFPENKQENQARHDTLKAALEARGYDVDHLLEYRALMNEAGSRQGKNQRAAEFAQANPAAAILANALSVVNQTFAPVEYPVDIVRGWGHSDPMDKDRYRPLTAPEYSVVEQNAAIRGTTAEMLAKIVPLEIGGQNVAAFGYQTFMSMVDSAVMMEMGGKAAEALMGLSAAAQTADEIIQKGGSYEQMFWGGLAAGVAETFFEHFSIENLRAMKGKPVTSFRVRLENMAKQGITELSEEAFTEVANILSDALIMADKSEFAQRVEEYRRQGMGEDDAWKAAFYDAIAQVGWAGAGGLLSGVGMSGATMLTTSVDATLRGRQMDAEEVKQLVDYGLQTDKDGAAYQFAEQIAGKEKPSNYEKGSLQQGVELDIAQKEAAAGAVMEALDRESAGRLSNSQVSKLLDNDAAVQLLTERAGLELTEGMTKSQQRQAVRQVLAEINSGVVEGKLQLREAVKMLEENGGRNGAYAARELYDGTVAVDDYFSEFTTAYMEGRIGQQLSYQEGETLTRAQKEAAWKAGQMDAQEARAESTQQDAEGENIHEQGEVHLRGSGQRADGADPGGAVQGVERDAGQDQGGRVQGRSADREAAGLTYEEAGSTAAQGIGKGSTADSVYVLRSGETESIKKARDMARARGKTVIFFGKGNLTIDGKQVRGYITGDRVFIRADHPVFTADQLMRHELGHDSMDAGRLNADAVRERLDKMGVNIDALAEMYAQAYAAEGIQMTPEEIWTEIICDSLGDMNIFSDRESAQLAQPILDEVKAASEADMEGKETRGPPGDGGGHMSAELSKKIQDLTESDVREQLERIYSGKLKRGSYIPVRRNTPGILIEQVDLYTNGKTKVDDLPVVIEEGKAYNAMEEDAGYGENRGHGLSPDGVVEVIKAMDDPDYIVAQRNGRFAEVVRIYDGEAKSIWAVLQLGEMKDGLYLNGYSGGKYNVMVTAFSPDNLKKYLHGNGNVVIYEKGKASPQRGSGSFLPSHLNGGPFADSVSQGDGKGKDNFSQGHFSHDLQSMEELRADNEAMREEMAKLKARLRAKTGQAEYWKQRSEQMPGQKTLRRGDTRALAKSLIQEWHSTLGVEELTDDVTRLGEYIIRGREGWEELTYERAKEMALEVAKKLINSASVLVDEEYAREYKGLRDYLRDQTLYVDESTKEDIPDFNDFRKRYFGRIRLSNGPLNIDSIYEEMADRWPEFFSVKRETVASDQLMRIAEVLDTLTPVYENPYRLEMSMAIEYSANEILDRLMSDEVRENPKNARQWKDQKARDYVNEVKKRERTRRQEAVKGIIDYYQRQKEAQALLKVAQRLKKMRTTRENRAVIDAALGDLDTVAVSITGKKIAQLNEIAAEIARMQEADPDFQPDPQVMTALTRLSATRIADMTLEDVRALTKCLLHIENEIRTYNRMIDSEDRREIYAMGQEVIMDMDNAKGAKALGIGAALDKYVVTEALTPVREARRLTGYVDSDPLYKASVALADGQRKMYEYTMKAGRQFEAFTKDKKFMEGISGARAKEIEISGFDFRTGSEVKAKITPAMRISLYLHSMNYENQRHMSRGGVTIPEMKLYKKGKLAEAYADGVRMRMTPSQVRAITANMTEQERQFARAVQRYFNVTSKDSINEVSEKLKGWAIAEVENYFPINTDSSFTGAEFESLKHDGTIQGMGFLKDRQAHAANPILLRDADLVLEQAIRMHGKYVGLAIPVRNFQKLWNMRMVDAGRSLREAVNQTWKPRAAEYIEKMMTDLQSGRKDSGPLDKLLMRARSNYAGAVLTLNASVAVKQAASYPTAAAVLGWTPLARAMADLGPVDLDLIARYTPLQWYRSQGFSTQELGDIASRSNSKYRVVDWMRGKDLPKGLNWIQGMDLLTTRKLWKASEYYVRAHNKALVVGSDAYYTEVAKVYNRVIEETQPNYTTMQRAQIQRQNGLFSATLSMFKTQPLQNFNILYDAYGNWAAKRQQYKAGAVTKETLKEARAGLGRAVGSQVAAAAVFAAMGAIWAAFRGKMSKYKDKDDELTFESFVAAFLGDMLGSTAGMVPGGSEAWELLTSKITGGRYYGLDINAVSTVQDAITSVISLGELAGDTLKSGVATDWNSVRLKAAKSLDGISKGLGVPFENVNNLFTAAFRWAAIAAVGEYRGEYLTLKLTKDPETNGSAYYDILYKALANDREQYASIYDDMLDSGFAPDKIKAQMENRMKKAQGVTRAVELPERYMPPAAEVDYSRILERLTRSKVWGQATEPQRDKVEDMLYEITMGTKTGAKIQEKIDAGAVYGLDSTEYLLYRLALSMVDKPTESGKLGTYTNEEVEAAVRMVPGLNDAERDYLWTSQGRSEKNKPQW